MKLAMICTSCAKDPNHKGPVFTLMDPRDDGMYEFTCPQNHKNTVALQEQKFEIFYDAGLFAIVDEYYRDAVVSFAASVERFHEFAIRVMMEEASGEEQLYQECWKKVANQSERQLGAFIFLWAQRFKARPALLKEEPDIKFRNAVVHKGKFANQIESIEFAKAVLDVLQQNVAVLLEHALESVRKVVQRDLAKLRRAGAGETIATMSMATLVSLNCKWDPPMTFDRYLSYVRQLPGVWQRRP